MFASAMPGGLSAAVASALLVPAMTTAEGPCEGSFTIEPSRGFVGQPVLHRSVVIRGEGEGLTWIVPPQFTGFRAERREAIPAERVVRAGQPARRNQIETTLFPARVGNLQLPPARLRCGVREVEIPGPAFAAMPWPEAGRTEEFTGVVGSVHVVASSVPTVALGAAARVQVTTRGNANLLDASPRLAVTPQDTEIFRRTPRLQAEAGRRTGTIRHDYFDLVPRHAGPLRIEPVRIVYLDVTTGAYRVAETPPLTIEVQPGSSPAIPQEQARAGSVTEAEGESPSSEASPRWPWAAGGLLLLGLAGVAALRRTPRDEDPAAAGLRQFDRSQDTDSRSVAMEQALRARILQRGLDPARSTTEALLECSPDEVTRECIRALAELERARFGGAGHGHDLDARLEAIRALLARSGAP